MSLTCLIIEDEFLSRRSLERLCARRSDLSVLGAFDNARAALRFLEKQPVDLLWLDVELPDLSGFELMKRMRVDPMVVMTTCRTDYAFDAYQYNVVDYLKKPLDQTRFGLAVDRVQNRRDRRRAVLDSDGPKLQVRAAGRTVSLSLPCIDYVENLGDYVRIVTESQSYVVYTTMKSLEESLGDQFSRVHRSYIINTAKIIDIEENTLLISGKLIPVSRANKSDLLNKLNLL